MKTSELNKAKAARIAKAKKAPAPKPFAGKKQPPAKSKVAKAIAIVKKVQATRKAIKAETAKKAVELAAYVAPVVKRKYTKRAKAKKSGTSKPHLMTCACGHRGYQHSRAPYAMNIRCQVAGCPCNLFNPAGRPATRTANVPHRSTRTMSLATAIKQAHLAAAALHNAIAAAQESDPETVAAIEPETPAPIAKKTPKPPPAAATPAVAPDIKKLCKEYAGLYGRAGLEAVLKKYTSGTIADIPADKMAEFIQDLS